MVHPGNDQVNVAARLETTAGVHQILVRQRIYSHVKKKTWMEITGHLSGSIIPNAAKVDSAVNQQVEPAKSRLRERQGAAVVLYRKALTTQVEDPVSAGRCGGLGFPTG